MLGKGFKLMKYSTDMIKKTVCAIMTAAFLLCAVSGCAPAGGEQNQSSSAESAILTTAAPDLTSAVLSGDDTPADVTTAIPDTGDDGSETGGQGVDPEPTGAEATTSQTEPPVSPVDLGNIDIQLLEHVETLNQGNYVFSPLSLLYTLGMIMAGADGNTLEEFRLALGISGSELEDLIKDFNHFDEWFADKIDHDIREYDRLPDSEKAGFPRPDGAVSIENSVWKKNGIGEFTEDYRMRLEMFDAGQFSFDPGDAVEKINGWCREKTEGMIDRLLDDGFDTGRLAVVFLSVLYFRDGWSEQFLYAGNRTFTDIRGTGSEKEFISSEGYFRYYKDDATELVVIPMSNDVEMVFVLGDASDFAEKKAKSEEKKVNVYIPKFEIETSLAGGEIREWLESLGVHDAFDPSAADFGRMFGAGAQGNVIGEIIQKSRIKIDEKGVEAAAATFAPVMATAPGEPSDSILFDANRPFRFFVTTAEGSQSLAREKVLFEGRLAE